MNLIKTTDKIGFPELRGSLAGMRYPAIVEPKLDGELNKWMDGYLVNKYGTKREWKLDVPSGTVLLGELIYKNGKAGELYELLKHKKDDDLKFVPFDLLSWGDKDTRGWKLEDRRGTLLHQLRMGRELVDMTYKVKDEESATISYEKIITEGYEGAVIKSLDSTYVEGPCSWVKLKKKDRNELLVVSIDKNKERMEVMHGTTIVGVKLPSKYKKLIRVGQTVTIEHQGVLESGSLRHPVYIPTEVK